jgi:hypothetical protein
MKPVDPHLLTINGGSSSIKFALFETGDSLRRILQGGIERIAQPEATLRVKGLNQAENFSRVVTAPDHTAAVGKWQQFDSEFVLPAIDRYLRFSFPTGIWSIVVTKNVVRRWECRKRSIWA